jgi:hypothetical protein
VSSTPIIPAEILAGIDEAELRSRAEPLGLLIDPADPLSSPLLWSLAFELWPDLLPDPDPDTLTRYYNQYYWFERFVSAWQAAHGKDAGLEQQAFKVLENAPEDVDWDVVGRLLKEPARDAPGTGPDPADS